jgi:hypothetical protein
VPITEVGSLAVGIGWLSACLAYLARSKREAPGPRITAAAGALVSGAIVVMKALPGVPGSFTAVEWLAFGIWLALGATFWTMRGRTGSRRRQ